MSKEAKEKFVTLDAGINQVTVGTIPMSKLAIRRKNYRKMNAQQKETLQASVDKFGFQDLITVVKNEDGTYGIVDGHHRVEELQSRGADRIPVVLLPEGLSKTDADLGMLSFNVSAEVVDAEFATMIQDLMEAGADADEIRKHATISSAFMDALQTSLSEPADMPDDSLQEGVGGGKTPKAKKPPSTKLVVLLYTDPETKEVYPTFGLTHKDTILDSEVRAVLEAEGLKIEEVEPVWFENGPNLLEKLAESATEEETE